MVALSKLLLIIAIVGLVTGAYLLLLVVMPVISDLALSANTTMNSTSNMSQYPGTSGFLMSTPWIIIWIPGVLGLVAIIGVLRSNL